jgi:hypothetical protein
VRPYPVEAAILSLSITRKQKAKNRVYELKTVIAFNRLSY